MISVSKCCLVIVMFVIVSMGIVQGSPLDIQMTIDAIDDAGQYPTQDAYLKFVYPSGETPITTDVVHDRWESRVPVDKFASDNKIPDDWHLESAGNIWSPDNDYIVGDALINLPAGIYRVSVVDGAFMYDSFDWSPYEGQWWWQLNIQSSMLPESIILGDTKGFPSAQSALANSFLKYLDVPVNEGGSLNFWVWDWNSIDNSGSLTFDVATAPIPEPSTLILTGTGLFFLVRRLRRSLIPLN
jgi:hypothetical protein